MNALNSVSQTASSQRIDPTGATLRTTAAKQAARAEHLHGTKQPTNVADATAEPASLTEATPITIDDILEHWGESGTQYDLTGDGKVDINDLFAVLNQMAEQQQDGSGAVDDAISVSDAADSNISVDDTDAQDPDDVSTTALQDPDAADEPADDEPETTIDGLLAAWGTDDPMYDLNADGVVDIDDLFELMGRLSEGPKYGDGKYAIGKPDVETLTGHFARRVSGSLVDRLAEQGFTGQPPTNLRQVVSGLGLVPQIESQIFQNLAEYYQNGLGLDYVV
jgi:hypothetical protein